MGLFMMWENYLQKRPKVYFDMEYNRAENESWSDYIVRYVANSQSHFAKYCALLSLKDWIHIAIIWPIAGLFLYFGLYNVAYSSTNYMPNVFLEWFGTETAAYQFDSYSLFIVAGATCSLAFVALEGTIFPLTWVSRWWCLFPVRTYL